MRILIIALCFNSACFPLNSAVPNIISPSDDTGEVLAEEDLTEQMCHFSVQAANDTVFLLANEPEITVNPFTPWQVSSTAEEATVFEIYFSVLHEDCPAQIFTYFTIDLSWTDINGTEWKPETLIARTDRFYAEGDPLFLHDTFYFSEPLVVHGGETATVEFVTDIGLSPGDTIELWLRADSVRIYDAKREQILYIHNDEIWTELTVQ